MAGKRGMKMPADVSSLRQNIWRSIRIMRTFTIPTLMTTVPGLKYENCQKFVRNLVKHRYVSKIGGYKGGRAGDFQMYVICKDTGPIVPVLGIGRTEKFLVTGKERKKETKKESEKEKEREEESGHDNDRPDATAA